MLPLSDFIKLAIAMGDGGAVRQGRRSFGRILCGMTAAVVATGCAIATVACLLGALWITVRSHMGTADALLAVAGVLLILCLIAFGLMRYAFKPPPAPPPARIDQALLLAEVTRLISEHKGVALLAALLAGLFVGGQKN